jgi:hypothetical protein
LICEILIWVRTLTMAWFWFFVSWIWEWETWQRTPSSLSFVSLPINFCIWQNCGTGNLPQVSAENWAFGRPKASGQKFIIILSAMSKFSAKTELCLLQQTQAIKQWGRIFLPISKQQQANLINASFIGFNILLTSRRRTRPVHWLCECLYAMGLEDPGGTTPSKRRGSQTWARRSPTPGWERHP